MAQKKIPDISPSTPTGFVQADDAASASTIALRDASGNLAMSTATASALNNAGWTSLGYNLHSSSFSVNTSTNTGTSFGLNSNSSPVTASLEAANSVPAGKILVFFKSDSSVNASIVAPNGSDTIDGVNASFSIYNQWDLVALQSDGVSNWIVLFTHKSNAGALANKIADPGNAGAIPVNQGDGYVDIVTAGSETRTIAAPAFQGQQLLLVSKTHVGNAVVTVASTVNATGNNTITISAAGQNILLAGVINGSTLRWMVVANDGTALSTV